MEFEHLLLQGILEKLGIIFDVKSPIFISTNDRYRLADYIKRQNVGDPASKLQYPLLFVQMKNASSNPDTYNTHVLNRHPLYGTVNKTDNKINAHKMIPVRYQYELVHITQKYTQMFTFVKTCLIQNIRRETNFTVLYDDNAVSIKAYLGDNVSVPEKDASVDLINIYETIVEFTVDAYVTDALGSSQAQILNQPILKQIDVKLEVAMGGKEPVLIDEFLVDILP